MILMLVFGFGMPSHGLGVFGMKGLLVLFN